MKNLTILFLFIATLSNSQTLIKLKQLEKAAGTGSTVTTSSVGVLTFVPEQTLTISGSSLSISRGNTVSIPSSSTTLVAGNGISLTNSGTTYTVNAQPIYAILSTTVASSSTVSATSTLTINLPAGTYEINGIMSVTTSSTGGVKYNLIQNPTSIPTTNPLLLVRGLNASSTTISNQPLSGNLSSNAIMTVASTAPMTITGLYVSTGGVLELGFAAGANGTTVSLLPNSYISARRIQ